MTIKINDGGIRGSIGHVGGDIVGRDLIVGGNSGGEVACDFIWKGSTIKGLCFPEDQRTIQRQIDKFVDGKITADELLKKIEILSPSMVAVIKRLL